MDVTETRRSVPLLFWWMLVLGTLAQSLGCGDSPSKKGGHEAATGIEFSFEWDDNSFTNKLNMAIRPGMTRTEVEKLLGLPSGIHTQVDGVLDFDYLRPRSEEWGTNSQTRLLGFVIHLRDDRITGWHPTWESTIPHAGFPPRRGPSFEFLDPVTAQRLTAKPITAEFDERRFIESIKALDTKRRLSAHEKASLAGLVAQVNSLVKPGTDVYFSTNCNVFVLLRENFNEIKELEKNSSAFKNGNVSLRGVVQVLGEWL